MFDRLPIQWLMCSLAVFAGCSGKPSHLVTRSVAELGYKDRGRDVHALIFADGGAQVDFSSGDPNEPSGQIHTVLLPAHPKEITRLIAAIAALDDASAAPLWDSHSNRDQVFIRCGLGSRYRDLYTREDQLSRNRLWGGLVEEFKDVAQVRLATALYYRDIADAYLATGRLDRASESLDDAAEEFSKWESSFRSRYCDGIWEPGVTGSKFTVDDMRIIVGGGPVGPRQLTKVDLSVEKAVELAKRSWGCYVGLDVATTESNGTITVTYSAEFMKGEVAGMPATVPARIRDFVNTRNRPKVD